MKIAMPPLRIALGLLAVPSRTRTLIRSSIQTISPIFGACPKTSTLTNSPVANNCLDLGR